MSFPYPDWADQAACRELVDFCTWRSARQKRVCGRCPVRFACLSYAMEVEPDPVVARYGTTYGGLTGEERAELLYRRRRRALAA